MLSYNILNDFVEKLKSGNVTPDDLVKVGNAVKNADLQVKYEVENIKAIPSDILNEVKCGDVIAKKTDEQYHCYIVTYKQENHGICLTYFDASVVETQSYDYVTDAWVYNSEDKTNILDYTAGDNVSIINGVISATDTKYTAGDNITITDGVISASGGDLWESLIHVSFAGSGTFTNTDKYYMRLITKEEITTSNINTIVGTEIDKKTIPLTPNISTNGKVACSIARQTSYVSVDYLYIDTTDNLIKCANISIGVGSYQFALIYSHKLN